MSTHLSRHFEQIRLSLGLKPSELARKLGNSNYLKTGSRIRKFELSGVVSDHLLQQLAGYFQVNAEVVANLREKDEQEKLEQWNRWANEPIQPHLIIRILESIYIRQDLPTVLQVLSQEEAEAWAASVARDMSYPCWLVWSRRLTVCFDEFGTQIDRFEATLGKENNPFTEDGNKRFVFGLDQRGLLKSKS